MKKMIIILLMFILTGLLVGGIILIDKQKSDSFDKFKLEHKDNKGTLMFEGNPVTNENVYIFFDDETNQKYAVFPITELLIAKGCKIEWENDNCAKIFFQDKEYTLDLKNKTIASDKESKSFGFIAGGMNYCYVERRQVYLNSSHMKTILYVIDGDFNYQFDINCTNNTVDVFVKTGDGGLEPNRH